MSRGSIGLARRIWSGIAGRGRLSRELEGFVSFNAWSKLDFRVERGVNGLTCRRTVCLWYLRRRVHDIGFEAEEDGILVDGVVVHGRIFRLI